MKKNVVILGGGFGGLRAALSIAHELKSAHLLNRYAITLIDRKEYHTYTPLLYLVAVPPTAPAKAIADNRVARRFQDILKGSPIRFLQAEVAELDLERGDIHLTKSEVLKCDYLVLAPGSETNYFGIPGLENNSLALKTFYGAKKIQVALSEALSASPVAKIVIGGGGPTGIELAGEIKHRYPKARVTIVEAAPTLLPGFSPLILQPAEKRLRKLGVEIITNEPIASVTKNKAVSKSNHEVPFDVLIWTGGVKAPAFLATLSLKTEPRGRIETGSGMLCVPQTPDLKLHPRVYALGDSVCLYDPQTSKPLPGVAPSAIEQAIVAAENILEDILETEGVPHHVQRATYKPREFPYVLPIGGNWAVAKIGPVAVTGPLASLFRKVIEIDYRLSLRA